jgi:tetratricopeptide (TPR) repeat protein
MEAPHRKKAPTRARVSRRNASRRWCIPPALQNEPDELLEGVGLLDELRTPVGLVLWQSLRDVMLWAQVDAEERVDLFTPQAARARLGGLLESGAEPALEVSLTTLAGLVGSPETANPEIVSLVCIQVSRWAEGRGAFATAMGFAQAAALAVPLDPGPALAAGALALRWRRLARAETWLRRAIGLARRGKHWEQYAEAYVELGALYVRRGAGELGERFYTQGLRAARRWGLTTVRGAAHHGLLLRALESGDLDEAERHARGAMRAYGRGHPRLPELEHDEAYLWVRQEHYARAITRLQKLLPTRVEPIERSLTLAILAHAAAGLGDTAQYEEYAMDAWTVIRRHPGEEGRHGRALLELARASVVARDWYHVEQAVRVASESVSPISEGAVATQVADIAAMLRARRAKPRPAGEEE